MLEGVSENTLHLKIFRRIARTDLEILFPNAKIRFTPFESFSAVGSAPGADLVRHRHGGAKFVAAVAISMFFVVFTIAGAVGAIIRAVTNFFNTRTRYMAKLGEKPLLP